MTDEVQASYRHCARMARRAASSFYWSFWLLPRAKRRAMYALYAFSRYTDDVGDSQQPLEQRRRQLDQWRRCFEGPRICCGQHPLLPALADTVERYQIPLELLRDVIDGVAMDLQPQRYASFAELEQYCYRVASAVGLACVQIWGSTTAEVRQPAIRCGVAFQLTNILRDLGEDARRGRIYLPLDDLQRFDYGPEELLQGICDGRLQAVVRFEIQRAEQLFCQALSLPDCLHPDGRRAAGTMMATYWQLLQLVKRRSNHPLAGRARLGTGRKLAIALSVLLSGGPRRLCRQLASRRPACEPEAAGR